MESTTSLELPSQRLSLKDKLLNKYAAASRYLRGGPSHFLMYVFGRFRIVRSVMLRVYRMRRSRVPSFATPVALERTDISNAGKLLSKDGFFEGLQLRPDVMRAIRLFAKTSTCYGDEDGKFPFKLYEKDAAERRYGRKIFVGRLDNPLGECQEVQALASDPTILAIARDYFGCEPVLLGSRIWWSFATNATAAEQMSLGQGWHYDLDGYRALAFFFYLTDTEPSTGAHICVKGSHVRKPLRSLLSLYKGQNDSDIEKWYGKERQVTLCGPAGSGFAEDIFCFHKGLHPQDGDRLLLQLRFGICSYDKPLHDDH